MEALIAIVVLILLVLALVFPVLAIVAFVRTRELDRRVKQMSTDLRALEARLEALGKRAVAERAAEPAAATAAPAAAPPSVPAFTEATVVLTAPVAPEPARSAAAMPSAAPSAPPRPEAPPPTPVPPRVEPPPPSPPAPPASRADFATTLGPKLLTAAGSLFFMVFLGLFVKYAWENNWVGPTGRVLFGAVTGVALVALGARMISARNEFRPLGQGLAAAGVAGLYVSAFAAHGFYDLVPREVAGVFMVVITANAVLLAARLDARLLAALAWIGGYMTPVLLSTHEDKVIALYLYLALLDAGALVLDHRKPWPETVPLALFGTMVLYGGWYSTFFTEEKFAVAAFGLVLFTALFALGMAKKERGFGLGFVFMIASIGVADLAARVDEPVGLLVISLALGAGAFYAALRVGRWLALAAGVAIALPFVVWMANHYHAESFGLAALWVLGGMAMFVIPVVLQDRGEEGSTPARLLPLEPVVLVAGAIAGIVLCAQTNRPLPILGLLAAQAGLAVLARKRFDGAETIGAAGAALAVAAWFASYYRDDTSGDAFLIALPIAGAYLLITVIRTLWARQPLRGWGVATHMITATLTWSVLFRVLYDEHHVVLGLVSVALAAVYLALGLVTLRAALPEPAAVRVTLGLAAAFLTIAIPVQLGLHGITVAWAVEGVLLVWLGLRFESALARAGGYAVVAVTVLRLFARHTPLHAYATEFTPVFNAAFGTWLFVIAAVAAAAMVARPARAKGGGLDRVMGPVLSVTGLFLLFGLLTTETSSVFAYRVAAANLSGDMAAAETARLMGKLSISVLWTLFATALLASGLFARSRPLFYSAYALFAITAAKVVLVDLANTHALYRMLSFLALGILLMAGAWLNLRFRERLLPREAKAA